MCNNVIFHEPVPLKDQGISQASSVLVTYKPSPASGNLSQVGNLNYRLPSLLENISLEAFNNYSLKPNSFSKG